MKINFTVLLVTITAIIAGTFEETKAQNNSPYWSMAGNSNATKSSKLGTTNSVSLRFFTKNAERMRIDTSGNVGIGVTNLNFFNRLQVVGTSTGTDGAAIFCKGAHGIEAQSIGSFGYGVLASSSYIGVYSYGSTGVSGESTNSTGFGVYGYNSSNTGGAGVYGKGRWGVRGEGSLGGFGVYGYNPSTAGGAGVYGESINGGYAGWFNGNVYISGTYGPSDRKLKQNIADLKSAMDIINKLQPKEYEYRQDGNYKLMNLPKGKHFGLVAQDLEQILPNLVKETTFDTRMAHPSVHPGLDSTSNARATTLPSEEIEFKAVNYTELIPLLIKAIQEQQQQIEELRLMVSKSTMEQSTSGNYLSAAYLEQNTPNPFSNNTIIRYHIPINAINAKVVITDMKGAVVKTIALNKESGQVALTAGALAAGTYTYGLWVDNNQVDSKHLIITR